MKAVKWLASGFILLVIVALVVLAYFLASVDPNEYKAEIKRLAAKQGVGVDITGDLSWQLFPALAIHLGETRITGIGRPIPNTRFASASLNIDWRALLGGQIAIRAVNVVGADIRLADTEQAATAAAAPVAGAPGSTEQKSGQDGKQNFTVVIDRFNISGSRITMPVDSAKPKTGERQLADFSFSGQDLNLTGEQFAVAMAFKYSDPSLKNSIGVALTTDASINLAQEIFTTSDTELTLSPNQQPPIKTRFDARFNGPDDSLDVPSLKIETEGISATATLGLTEVRKDLKWQSNLDIPNTNLRKLLTRWGIDVTALPEQALQKVQLNATAKGSLETIEVSKLALTLDDTQLAGRSSLKLVAPKRLQLQLQGTELDLNRYTTSGTTQTTASNATSAAAGAVFAPLLAPVAWLNGGTGTIDLGFKKLTINTLQLDDVKMATQITGKLVQLANLSANTLDGSLKTTATINLKPIEPQVSFSQQITGISLAKAAKTFANTAYITGTMNLDVQGNARGATTDQLHSTLVGSGRLQIAQPKIAQFNVERAYCDVAALVEKTETVQQWPAGTQLSDLTADIKLEGYKILLNPYATAVGNLTVQGNGVVDTRAMAFDVLAVTRLNGDRTSANGCLVKSKRIRDRDIPIRCKDTFAQAGAKSCGPDGDIVKQLLQGVVLEKIREKSGMDDKTGEALEGLLKGIFGR